ncbi:MAG: zinc-ribbon domain-containing protein [Pseudomonadota bacterium]
MRLICPNCDAQYEVVDDVIPAEGRDVQCSNCGQTWFQHHPDHMPEPEPEEAVQDHDAPDLDENDTPGADEERVTMPDAPQRRELDSSVADILRQEAELEARAREGDALESQPELGLEDGDADDDRRARDAQARTARMRGEPADAGEVAAAAAALGSRRDLLPDIEEINSTLRSAGDRQSGASGPTAEMHAERVPPIKKTSGFRRGFMLMVLLTVILGAVYVMAPEIAQAVPQADPYLSAFVAQVDEARLWLDGRVTSVLSWLDEMATSSEG